MTPMQMLLTTALTTARRVALPGLMQVVKLHRSIGLQVMRLVSSYESLSPLKLKVSPKPA